jgi:XRE family transcriptional regulator, regulator of sulfur utilization
MPITQSRENIDAVRRQLGANVRRWRNRRGWTQDQLAEHANISAKFVGEVERGEDNPSLETLWALVCALKIEWQDLLAEADASA